MEITWAGSDYVGGTPGNSRWAGGHQKYYVTELMFFAKTVDTVSRSEYISWSGLASQSDHALWNVYIPLE